jgi:hypothetical protein
MAAVLVGRVPPPPQQWMCRLHLLTVPPSSPSTGLRRCAPHARLHSAKPEVEPVPSLGYCSIAAGLAIATPIPGVCLSLYASLKSGVSKYLPVALTVRAYCPASQITQHTLPPTPACELCRLRTAYLQDQDALQFKQNPTFEDCFPSSEKHYQPVLHEETGAVLQVRTEARRDSGFKHPVNAQQPTRPLLWLRLPSSRGHLLAFEHHTTAPPLPISLPHSAPFLPGAVPPRDTHWRQRRV